MQVPIAIRWIRICRIGVVITFILWAWLAPLVVNAQTADELIAQIEAAIDKQAWDEAKQLLAIWLEQYPTDGYGNYQMGLILTTESNPEAVEFLRQAIAADEYAERAIGLLGIWATDGDFNSQLISYLITIEAWPYTERLLMEAIQINPLDWISFAYLGYVRDQQGKDGHLDIETALGLAPYEAIPYYFLGLHWRDQRGDVETGRLLLVEAYFKDPTNPNAAAEVGWCFELAGDYEEAAEWYNVAVSVGERDVVWLSERARFYADTEYMIDYEGMDYIWEAYRTDNINPDILASVGRGLFVLEQYEQAQVYLEQAVQLDANNWRAWSYLADLVWNRGDRTQAALIYRTIIESTESGNPYALRSLRLLEQLNGLTTPPN